MSETGKSINTFCHLVRFKLSLVKLKLSPLSIMMKIHVMLKLPAMSLKEIGVYKKCLLSQCYNGPLNIFEYGSGFSTIYFAKFLKRKKVPFHIYSIDNNAEWHTKIKNLVKTKGLDDVITLYLSEFTPFWEKEGWNSAVLPKCGQFAPKLETEFEYINIPLRIGVKFNFISVDARFRRRCLEVVTKCLTEKGIVFLHDAQKTKYHEPLSLYKYSKFINGGRYYPFEKKDWKIWIGSLNDLSKKKFKSFDKSR